MFLIFKKMIKKSLITVIYASGLSCVAFKPQIARFQFHPAQTDMKRREHINALYETAHCDRYHHMLTNTQAYPGLNLRPA